MGPVIGCGAGFVSNNSRKGQLINQLVVIISAAETMIDLGYANLTANISLYTVLYNVRTAVG